MKLFLVLIVVLTTLTCRAQQEKPEISLAYQIKKYFNYDSLSHLSCLNTPQGIYGIKFSVDNNGKIWNCQPANDSVIYLNRLFIEAIEKSIDSFQNNKLAPGDYMQYIFFNSLSCNMNLDKNNSLPVFQRDTTNSISINYKEVSKILSDVISSIETSVIHLQKKVISHTGTLILPFAIINNENPNWDKNKPGFKNDIRQKTMTKAEIDTLEKLIEQRKKNRSKN